MDLKLPHLGEGADSGTVVNLLVKEGDTITKDQPVLELENEKAVATIPSTAAGVVAAIFVKKGDKISVGARLLSITENGAAPAGAPAQPATKAPAAARKPAAPEPRAEAPAGNGPPGPRPGVEPAAAPSLRKLARDLGIDLARIGGSANGGRIVLEDIRAYIEHLQNLASQPKAAPAAGSPSAAPGLRPGEDAASFAKFGPVTTQPLSPLRAVIARRMSENWLAVPRVTQFEEADITVINDLRKKYAPEYEKKGARLTLTSFALKIVAELLKKHPIFNSSLDEAGQQIVLKQYIHLGVAVDTDAGLIVPVIRDADKKNMLQLSQELEALAKKAKDRKVSGDELKGGSFTISNQGGIGGGHFTPIVNKPEVAILGLGRGAMKPVVRGTAIEARMLLPMAVSYDHRVIDGGIAARFAVDLVQAFQNFAEDIVKQGLA